MLELADPNGFRVWKLMDMDEIPRWSKGNVVMLGDAKAPVLPFSFSGASMAIEDALTLSTLLPSDIEKEQLRERLELYEEIRRPRVGRVRDTGRQTARGGDADKEFMKEYFPFLAKHDAVDHAKKALAERNGVKA